MKNKFMLGLTLGLVMVSSIGLSSCNTSTLDGLKLRLYDKSTFKSIAESKESSKLVYTIYINSDNETGSDITLKNTEFKAVMNGNEYTALYFVDQTKYEYEDGVSKTYISEKSETHVVIKNEHPTDYMVSTTAFTIAFEEDIRENATFYYNNNEIKSLFNN